MVYRSVGGLQEWHKLVIVSAMVRFVDHIVWVGLKVFISLFFLLATGLAYGSSHGFAVFGNLKYASDFESFDYVNTEASKGGSVKYMAIGSYDSLNPFIDRGTPAVGVGLIYDSLLRGSQEEVGVAYGLLAESVRVSADRQRITFRLRQQARWHDGEPITSADVRWSFETLMAEGLPAYRLRLRDLQSIETPDIRTIVFSLKNGDSREMPLIIGGVPILPQHYWVGKEFGKTTLVPPLGSGAYEVAQVQAGKSIAYTRRADYWGIDLPINRGLYNFDRIHYDYYKDQAIAFEAFKAGAYDIREEHTAKFWATGYDIPAVKQGKIIKREFPHQRISNLQAIYLNLRNPLFQDIRTRKALNYAWNFEWVNKFIMHSAYTRLNSYFANHVLSAANVPASKAELELLAEYSSALPNQITDGKIFALPQTPAGSDGGFKNNREQLQNAAILLKEAGWVLRNGLLYLPSQNLDFRFTILLHSDAFTAHLQPFISSLKRLGIEAKISIVDPSQYIKRLLNFDYQSTIVAFAQTDIPGAEQREFWGSAAADIPNSNNIAGIKNPIIDGLAEKMVAAESYEELITITRALDRVLLWNYYTVLLYTINTDRIAYANRFCMPDKPLPYQGVQLNSWWLCEQP